MTTSKKQIAKPGAKYWQARTFDDSGASAVEFAVVFPIFLLMTLAILAYGIHFGRAQRAAAWRLTQHDHPSQD